MHAGGLLRDEQGRGDLAVGAPGDEQAQHLLLAAGELAGVARTGADRRSGLDEVGAAGDLADLLEQRVGPEVGGQRTSGDQLAPGGLAVATGGERHGEPEPGPRLVVRAAQPGGRLRDVRVVAAHDAGVLRLGLDGRGDDAPRRRRATLAGGEPLDLRHAPLDDGGAGGAVRRPSATALVSVGLDAQGGDAQPGRHVVVAGVGDGVEALDGEVGGGVELVAPTASSASPLHTPADTTVAYPGGHRLRGAQRLVGALEAPATDVERAAGKIEGHPLDAGRATRLDRRGQLVDLRPPSSSVSAPAAMHSSRPPYVRWRPCSRARSDRSRGAAPPSAYRTPSRGALRARGSIH